MWMNPDLKIYNTDIYLEGDDPALRTGMSCKAEIIVEQYQDVCTSRLKRSCGSKGSQPSTSSRTELSRNERFEIGLDNNSMVTITSGLDEGEIVSLTPPLKAAIVEPGSQTPEAGATGSGDSIMEQINEKLKAVNGTGTGRSVAPLDTAAGPQQGPGAAGSGTPRRCRARTGRQEGGGMPSAEQMEKMRKRLENMTPEEQQKEMEKMKQRFQNMTPEEREKMRQQRSQGGGRGPPTRCRRRLESRTAGKESINA